MYGSRPQAPTPTWTLYGRGTESTAQPFSSTHATSSRIDTVCTSTHTVDETTTAALGLQLCCHAPTWEQRGRSVTSYEARMERLFPRALDIVVYAGSSGFSTTEGINMVTLGNHSDFAWRRCSLLSLFIFNWHLYSFSSSARALQDATNSNKVINTFSNTITKKSKNTLNDFHSSSDFTLLQTHNKSNKSRQNNDNHLILEKSE